MDKKTLETLAEIRERLKHEYKHFPSNCCDISSLEIFDILGFDVFLGLFREGKKKISHFWNISSSREIVDLTAGQFGNFPDIYILNPNSREAKIHYNNGCHIVNPRIEIPESYLSKF